MTNLPKADQIFTVMDATWPPRRLAVCGPFLLRDGAGGGKRVSAATCPGGVASRADIAAAAQAMQQAHQIPLFGLRGDQDQLDQTLETMGYSIIDPVIAYCAMTAPIAARVPAEMVAVFSDHPIAIQAEIWAQGGIDAARLAVMARARGPKTYILARQDDHAAGAAFVAIHDGVAMLHALEIRPAFRRRGVGLTTMAAAASWAQQNGADVLSLVTTSDNLASNALYRTLGMAPCARYHYRILKD